MASADTLVAIFEAISQNLERDRTSLNKLDRDDGDSGDNMVANFQLVTNSLRKTVGKQKKADIGAALGEAAQVLRENGQGATAPVYAAGIEDAATKLEGKQTFNIDDLLPLLEGLLQGIQRANTSKPGEGSMLDAIVPGLLSYIEGKRSGQSDLEAILSALLNSRRGATSTAGASQSYKGDKQRDTTGEIDPGAAGAASMLEGLFGALLESALRGQSSQNSQSSTSDSQSQTKPAGSGNVILDMIGSLFK